MARFQKGKSGNPGGRLRRGLSITDHIKELLDLDYVELKRIHAYLEDKGEERLGKITVARLVACRLITEAIEGQSELTKELLNRADGKVADRLITDHRKTVTINIQLAGAPHNQLTQTEGELPEPRQETPLLEERNPERPSDGRNQGQ